MRRKSRLRGRASRVDTGAAWISYSDMMAALLLVFVLVLCYTIYQYFSAAGNQNGGAGRAERAALLPAVHFGRAAGAACWISKTSWTARSRRSIRKKAF